MRGEDGRTKLTRTRIDGADGARRQLERNILDAHARATLDEEGKLDAHTADEYVRAVKVAERRTGLKYDPTPAAERPASGSITDCGETALSVQAELVLVERGARQDHRGRLIYTAGEYADALLEARDRFGSIGP